MSMQDTETRPSSEVCMVVAMAQDGAIGMDGDMPWKRGLPVDLRHFKSVTMGYPIVMGRRTFESLPKGALLGRQNIVLSRNSSFVADGVTVAHDLEEAIRLCDSKERLFVIGGGTIYREALPYAQHLYITIVEHTWKDADTYFPAIDLSEWRCVHEEFFPADGKNLYDVRFTEWKHL